MPVGAAISVCRPARISGHPSRCGAVGCPMRSANQRATVVRNRLETEGKVPRERLFLVEPKLTAEGIQDKGAKTRVDFSLK